MEASEASKAREEGALPSQTTTEEAELEAEIVAEEEPVAAHASAAAMDETAAEEAVVEATNDAIEAARIEANARGEEIGVTMCELVPLLDVVGGVATASLEGAAASLAAKATAEAAIAARTEEETEMTLLADLQPESLKTSRRLPT